MSLCFYYRLEGTKVVPSTREETLCYFDSDSPEMETRYLFKSELAKCYVSTVFLALNHNLQGEPPYVFETLVSGGHYDGAVYRYSTYEEAYMGHIRTIEILLGLRKPDDMTSLPMLPDSWLAP